MSVLLLYFYRSILESTSCILLCEICEFYIPITSVFFVFNADCVFYGHVSFWLTARASFPGCLVRSASSHWTLIMDVCLFIWWHQRWSVHPVFIRHACVHVNTHALPRTLFQFVTLHLFKRRWKHGSFSLCVPLSLCPHFPFQSHMIEMEGKFCEVLTHWSNNPPRRLKRGC